MSGFHKSWTLVFKLKNWCRTVQTKHSGAELKHSCLIAIWTSLRLMVGGSETLYCELQSLTLQHAPWQTQCHHANAWTPYPWLLLCLYALLEQNMTETLRQWMKHVAEWSTLLYHGRLSPFCSCRWLAVGTWLLVHKILLLGAATLSGIWVHMFELYRVQTSYMISSLTVIIVAVQCHGRLCIAH